MISLPGSCFSRPISAARSSPGHPRRGPGRLGRRARPPYVLHDPGRRVLVETPEDPVQLSVRAADETIDRDGHLENEVPHGSSSASDHATSEPEPDRHVRAFCAGNKKARIRPGFFKDLERNTGFEPATFALAILKARIPEPPRHGLHAVRPWTTATRSHLEISLRSSSHVRSTNDPSPKTPRLTSRGERRKRANAIARRAAVAPHKGLEGSRSNSGAVPPL